MNKLWAKHQGSWVPLRLFLLYGLSVGVLPTIIFWGEFGNLEETEEFWDPNLVFSVLVCIPLIFSTYIGCRNWKEFRVLTPLLVLLTAFHVFFTALGWVQGLLGDPYSTSGLTPDRFGEYAKAFGVAAIPFLFVYLIWLFWPRRRGLSSDSA